MGFHNCFIFKYQEYLSVIQVFLWCLIHCLIYFCSFSLFGKNLIHCITQQASAAEPDSTQPVTLESISMGNNEAGIKKKQNIFVASQLSECFFFFQIIAGKQIFHSHCSLIKDLDELRLFSIYLSGNSQIKWFLDCIAVRKLVIEIVLFITESK